jgi:hypothetical protein
LQQVAVLEQKALPFAPDAVYLVTNVAETDFLARHLAGRLRAGAEIPYPYLRELAARAGVTASTPPEVAEALLRPYGLELTSWIYRSIAEDCRDRGCQPYWIYVSQPGDPEAVADTEALARLAQDNGFVVVNLSDAYRGHDPKTLQEREWDRHPNAEAQQLLADKLYATVWGHPAGVPPTN